MSEEWRVIEMAPAYAVSSCGRVKRIGRGKAAKIGRILKAGPDAHGYCAVSLSMNNKRIVEKVHVLVLLAFVGPRPSPKHHGAHDDGNKLNNSLENLFWKTPKENIDDKKRHGTHGIILCLDDVVEIRKRHKNKETYQKIADDLHVSKSAVAHIVKGRCWAGIGL